ncbi:hypothetical protein SISNIDRAFT_283534 [Sistotremastrum niveocremeum HHB9708]|uniref:Uncharacterized protein n=2 Tax=Sistotremastraceae TaxID=3402574 RepID=A0A164Y8W1_9AGAM|nr:hypothetical protein SISNIDRAFT_283534 [Sistotremastrum niveocremeum HHB9708]KZT42386.1 hypothetical protein SISSUDRAFT_1058737 [Sistotremastrum suecicum HHB10207 ss-3]
MSASESTRPSRSYGSLQPRPWHNRRSNSIRPIVHPPSRPIFQLPKVDASPEPSHAEIIHHAHYMQLPTEGWIFGVVQKAISDKLAAVKAEMLKTKSSQSAPPKPTTWLTELIEEPSALRHLYIRSPSGLRAASMATASKPMSNNTSADARNECVLGDEARAAHPQWLGVDLNLQATEWASSLGEADLFLCVHAPRLVMLRLNLDGQKGLQTICGLSHTSFPQLRILVITSNTPISYSCGCQACVFASLDVPTSHPAILRLLQQTPALERLSLRNVPILYGTYMSAPPRLRELQELSFRYDHVEVDHALTRSLTFSIAPHLRKHTLTCKGFRGKVKTEVIGRDWSDLRRHHKVLGLDMLSGLPVPQDER